MYNVDVDASLLPWSLDFDEDLLRVGLTHADTHSHGDKEC